MWGTQLREDENAYSISDLDMEGRIIPKWMLKK
jgi:hypothetical protein